MPEVLTSIDEGESMKKSRKVVTMKFRRWRHIGTDAKISRPEALGSPGEDWEEISRKTTPEHQRLQSAVVEAAKVERVVWEAPLTPQWVFELQATQKSLRSAVDALIAFEAENKIGRRIDVNQRTK